VSETTPGLQPPPAPEPLRPSRDTRKDTARSRSYRRRFGLGYVALALILALAGLATYFVWNETRGSDEPAVEGRSGAGWSDFAPQFDGLLAAKEIARHVQGKYRLSSGRTAVAITAERPVVQEIPILFLFYQPATARFNNDTAVQDMGVGIQYSLCGAGPACSVAEGRPSPERARWLRREGIELALFTFHYDPSVDHVLVYMPPTIVTNAQGQQEAQQTALVFNRGQLQSELAKPLNDTIPQRDRFLVTDALSEDEADFLDAIAADSFFSFEFQQGPNGNPIIVLDPRPRPL
jgi:hypothetical protein